MWGKNGGDGMTNREKINNMNNTELSEFLSENTPALCQYCFFYDFCNKCKPYNSCESVIFRWLESEVKK